MRPTRLESKAEYMASPARATQTTPDALTVARDGR